MSAQGKTHIEELSNIHGKNSSSSAWVIPDESRDSTYNPNAPDSVSPFWA
jgi:hypothetical protein